MHFLYLFNPSAILLYISSFEVLFENHIFYEKVSSIKMIIIISSSTLFLIPTCTHYMVQVCSQQDIGEGMQLITSLCLACTQKSHLFLLLAGRDVLPAGRRNPQ